MSGGTLRIDRRPEQTPRESLATRKVRGQGPTEPKRPEQSLGELVKEMTSELSGLFRQEVELAKVEAREELSQSVKAMVAMAVGGVAALLFLIVVSIALAELLDQGLNRALSFFIVAVLWAIVGGVLYSVGRKRMKDVDPVPRQTVDTLKEDAQWVRDQRN